MSGIFVTGHVRSGTSMTAGLFREHGVFFGDCGGGFSDNPKGRLENVWLKRTMHEGVFNGWPDRWFYRLKAEGYDGGWWGAKLMPKWWSYMVQTKPELVVLCYRPEADILASCERVGWKRSRQTILDRWKQMEMIRATYSGQVVRIDTPKLADGDYSQIMSAFNAIGLGFDEATADSWIEPEWFHAA